VRLPVSVRDRLVAQARANDRSATAERARIIRESLEPKSNTHLAEPRA